MYTGFGEPWRFLGSLVVVNLRDAVIYGFMLVLGLRGIRVVIRAETGGVDTQIRRISLVFLVAFSRG